MASAAGVVGPATTGVVESEIDGCVALFNPENSEALFLNETASQIWRLSDGEHSLDEIIALLAQMYLTDKETIGVDVSHTVSTLRRRGFLGPIDD